MSTTATISPETTLTAPANAFAFTADECCFETPKARDSSGLKRMAIDVLARTGQPVWHWYWGKVVHDMAGRQSKSKIAFDYRHDADEPIGYADKITGDADLRLGGELISRRDDDEAAKIMDLGPAGVPYEASIEFDPYSVELEYVPEGYVTNVNGQNFEGPLTVIRKWRLMRCALCLSGVDSGTETSFLPPQSKIAAFSLNWKGSPMTKTPRRFEDGETKEDEDLKKIIEELKEEIEQLKADGDGEGDEDKKNKEGEQDEDNKDDEDKKDKEGEQEVKLRAQLKRYTDRFGGEDGAKYFTDGLTFEKALDQHTKKLESSLKAAIAGREAAEAKLSQLNLGEKTGINTGKPQSSKKTFESMFKQAGA